MSGGRRHGVKLTADRSYAKRNNVKKFRLWFLITICCFLWLFYLHNTSDTSDSEFVTTSAEAGHRNQPATPLTRSRLRFRPTEVAKIAVFSIAAAANGRPASPPPPPAHHFHPSEIAEVARTVETAIHAAVQPGNPPTPPAAAADPCAGRYVYVHDLPGRFNIDMLRDCRTLSQWTDMCLFMSNAGLGPTLDNSDGFFADSAWFATSQFALEVIFDSRMRQYRCLTSDSSNAAAVFVPFYAGLDVARYLWGYNISVRDSTSMGLLRWLKSTPEWARMGGRDHFLVAGRITWDFRRLSDEETDWGSKFLLLPEAKNMTNLVIESSPWHSNDFAVPYPTYFHPSKDGEVHEWQERMRVLNRTWLFSFAGAPRLNRTGSIRGKIIEQCRESQRCNLMECGLGQSKCHSPASVMRMFQSSVFCLQPQGDSYTRRSAIDAMVAGCVPVFFHPGSAYVQYLWHLPRNYSRYSVFISEEDVREGKVRIEEVLSGFSRAEVAAMREEVIKTIPNLVYANPGGRLEKMRDAFDLAVEGVIERVRKIREGRAPVFEEEESWKFALVGKGGEHEWDRFFSKPRQ